MSFCIQCGAPLNEGQKFCVQCGAPSAGGSEGALDKLRSLQTQAPPPSKPSHLKPILVTVALIGTVVVGIALYLGLRGSGSSTSAAEKSSSKRSAEGSPRNGDSSSSKSDSAAAKDDSQDEDVSNLLNGIGKIMDKTGFGDPPPNPYQDLPVPKPQDMNTNLCDPDESATESPAPLPSQIGPSGIPLRKDLLVTIAWGRKSGDSESFMSVSKVTGKFTEIRDSGTYFNTADDEKGTPGADRRDVCADDLQTAHGIRTGFGKQGPRTSPGTTTIGVSEEVFNDLKTKGQTNLRYLEWMQVDGLEAGGGYLHWVGGAMTRVEATDVPFQLILNGTPTTVPAIHATGTLLVEDKRAREMSKDRTDQPLATEIYILDDPKNPLLLLFRMDINNFRVQVTELRFPLPQPERKIEQDLRKNKKAVVYGIYFDFNSDKIKPESEPVLKEIAEAMKDNPDWKLTVDGHTDGIGGDAANLDLSKRRAAAVKQALTARFAIGAERLETNGYGKSRPIDRNDTLEGRARNRRVELTRE